MELKEIVERSVCGDPRIFHAMKEHKKMINHLLKRDFLELNLRLNKQK